MTTISFDINGQSALGKGEAKSSILFGSTIKTPAILGFSGYPRYLPFGINQQNDARTYSWSPWKIRGRRSLHVPHPLRPHRGNEGERE